MEKTNMPEKIAAVESIIAKAAGISVASLRSHSRRKQLAEARMAVWFVAHEYLKFSYLEIGRVYGRDHTTIISGAKKIAGSPAKEIIVEGIKSIDPSVLENTRVPAKSIETWKFEEV